MKDGYHDFDAIVNEVLEYEDSVSLYEPEGLDALIRDMDRDIDLGKAVKKYEETKARCLMLFKQCFDMSEEEYKTLSLDQKGRCIKCAYLPHGTVRYVGGSNVLWPDPTPRTRQLVCFDCYLNNKAAVRHQIKKGDK